MSNRVATMSTYLLELIARIITLPVDTTLVNALLEVASLRIGDDLELVRSAEFFFINPPESRASFLALFATYASCSAFSTDYAIACMAASETARDIRSGPQKNTPITVSERERSTRVRNTSSQSGR